MTEKELKKLPYGQRWIKNLVGKYEIYYMNGETWKERMKLLQHYNQTVKVVIELAGIMDITDRKIIRVEDDYLELTNSTGRGSIIIERAIIRIVEADAPAPEHNVEEPQEEVVNTKGHDAAYVALALKNCIDHEVYHLPGAMPAQISIHEPKSQQPGQHIFFCFVTKLGRKRRYKVTVDGPNHDGIFAVTFWTMDDKYTYSPIESDAVREYKLGNWVAHNFERHFHNIVNKKTNEEDAR